MLLISRAESAEIGESSLWHPLVALLPKESLYEAEEVAIVQDHYKNEHEGEKVGELCSKERDDIVISHDLGEIAGADSKDLEQVEAKRS